MTDHAAHKEPLSPLVRMLIEIGPLAVFFIANNRFDIFTATAAFMVAIAISLAASWILARHIATMPLVTGAFVLVFGTLTLVLNDELFIKLKPTLVNGLFAAILFGGLLFGMGFGYRFRLRGSGELVTQVLCHGFDCGPGFLDGGRRVRVILTGDQIDQGCGDDGIEYQELHLIFSLPEEAARFRRRDDARR